MVERVETSDDQMAAMEGEEAAVAGDDMPRTSHDDDNESEGNHDERIVFSIPYTILGGTCNVAIEASWALMAGCVVCSYILTRVLYFPFCQTWPATSP